jgi:Domain of unknown function (DUF4148)
MWATSTTPLTLLLTRNFVEVIMAFITKILSAAFLLVASASVMAAPAPRLTPQECGDYPFVTTQGLLTHHEVMQELAELEAVGYQPANGNDPYYPDDIEQAKQRLWKEYARDCALHQPMAMSNPPATHAQN